MNIHQKSLNIEYFSVSRIRHNKCFTTQYFSSGIRIERGKVIGTLMFVTLDNVIGLLMGSLQLMSKRKSSIALVFVFNLYRAWCYSTTAVYVKTPFFIGRTHFCTTNWGIW